MITESFLNSCFSIVLSKNLKVKKAHTLYNDILDIVSFPSNKESIDIPISVKNKVECLQKICSMLKGGKTNETVLDSILYGDKFKLHRDFLDLKANEEVSDATTTDIIKQIRLRKKINALFENFDELNNVLNIIKDGSFDSIEDLIEDYEITIRKLYSNMMESNRLVTIEASASLDLAKDDFLSVLETIKQKYDRENKTPTGFPVFDGDILFGGLEPSRLYIFAGGSGSGKSTMLSNLIIKSAVGNANQILNSPKKSKNKVYVYITCENTIEESLLRTYQALFDKTLPTVLQEIRSGINIQERMLEKLKENNATIIMKYFPATSISALDIMGVLDEVIGEYGKESIMGIYIDYLDLLKSDTKYDMYRLELGHITLSLKTMAVQYNIPVVTATQLSRSTYRVQGAESLNLDQMSESIKKVEHADFVCLLAKDPNDDKIVHAKVGKNRMGQSNINIEFKTNFALFKFVSGSKTKNAKKQDISTDNVFPGLNDKKF